jgi:hypothetical protein
MLKIELFEDTLESCLAYLSLRKCLSSSLEYLVEVLLKKLAKYKWPSPM